MNDTSHDDSDFSHDQVQEWLGHEVGKFQQKFIDLKAGELPQIPVWNWQCDADRRLANEAALDLHVHRRDWPTEASEDVQLAYAAAAAVIVTSAVYEGVPTLLPRIAEHLDECVALLHTQSSPDIAAFRTRLDQLSDEVLFNTVDDHYFGDDTTSKLKGRPHPDTLTGDQLRPLSPMRGWLADSREEYLAGLDCADALMGWLRTPPAFSADAFTHTMVAIGRYRHALAGHETHFAALAKTADYLYLCARVACQVERIPMIFSDCLGSVAMTLKNTDRRYEPR